MPTNPTFTGNYVQQGKIVDGIIREEFAKTQLLAEGLARIEQGFKSEMTLVNASANIVAQAYECKPEDALSTLAVRSRKIPLCELMVLGKGCKKDLVNSVLEMRLRAGQNASNGLFDDAEYLSVVQFQFREGLAELWDNIFLRGDTDYYSSGTLSFCDGLLKKMKNNGITKTVAGTTLTVGNIIDELRVLYNATDPKLFYRSTINAKPYIAMNPRMHGLYKSALTAAAAFYRAPDQDNGGMFFDSVPIKILGNLPDNVMICTFERNIVVGFDSAADVTTLRTSLEWTYSASDQWTIRMDTLAGIDIGNEALSTVYGTNFIV